MLSFIGQFTSVVMQFQQAKGLDKRWIVLLKLVTTEA